MSDDLKSRIEGKYTIDPATGCWNWSGSIIGKGYGQLNVRCLNDRYAHRASYRAFNGNIPPGMNVLHRCDNRRCVNPAHLFLGSIGDNAQDMRSKGRHLYGERNAKAKLSEEQVIEIHRKHAAGDTSTHRLAREYGVGAMTISRILRGERWAHVKEAINAASR